jgi:hypothetical protein
MARVTAQQWLDKWGQRLNASGTFITSGVQAVTEAPGAKAAAAQDRMLTNLTAAITSGLWAKQVSGVSLSSWKTAMVNKGIPRIAQGVTAAQSNKTGVITALLNAVDSAAAAANAVPKGGLDQNIQRAVTFMRAMSAAAPRKVGG